jgi:hypothetical protein
MPLGAAAAAAAVWSGELCHAGSEVVSEVALAPVGELQPAWQAATGLATSSCRIRPAGGRALANFDQLPTKGSVWRGKCILAGDLVETPPVSGPNVRSAGRRPFQIIRKKGPSAPEFRSVDEVASPGQLRLQKPFDCR